MAAQPTADPELRRQRAPLYALDQHYLTATRVRRATAAILRLVKTLRAEDLAVLSHLQACAGTLDADADAFGADRPDVEPAITPAGGAPPDSSSDVYDTLIDWQARKLETGHVLNCLIAILLNAALDPTRGVTGSERRQIMALSQMIRGALAAGAKAPLLALIAGADGVRDLVPRVDHTLKNSKRVHVTFEGVWRRWLRHRIMGWTLEEPSGLRHLLNVAAPLQPDPDAPTVDLSFDAKSSAESPPSVPSIAIEGDAFEGLPDEAIDDRANALQFLRGRAYGGLSLSPDHYLPDELLGRLAKAAVNAGNAAIDAGLRLRGARSLSVALALAAGLRPTDIKDVKWSAGDATDGILLDPRRPALSVPLKRPMHAVNPKCIGGRLLESVDRFDWPIPPSLHSALLRLASPGTPKAGSAVLPGAGIDEGDGIRFAGVIAELAPELHVNAFGIRMAVAARLADRFGPEVAQLLLRDSLFTSLGPAYYCGVPLTEVREFVSAAQAQWFGDSAHPTGNIDGIVGSRLALRDDFAKAWPTQLNKTAYAVARKKNASREALRAERDRLAGALASATGNRPGNSLGVLHLDSVIPEYGLVILEDKQEDVLRRTRIAATGMHWLAALRRYLDMLCEVREGSDAPAALWARGVLESTHPLFSLPGGDDTQPVLLDAAAFRATMPEGLRPVDNFYRHRLNQALQASGVDWEMRHAQLGWVASPAHATADLSPLSPQLLAEQLGPVIDEVLVKDGWYSSSQRLARWSWNGVPMRGIADWHARQAEFERGHEESIRQLRQQFELHREEVEPEIRTCLARAVEACLPQLRIEAKSGILVRAPGDDSHHAVPIAITPEHHALLRDHIRRQRGEQLSPIDGLVAERLIHDLVVHAVHDRVAVGPSPVYRHLGFTSQLSPFLPGIGLAVRHAMALRARLREIASRHRQRDRAALVQLSILADTPYRDLDRSARILKASAQVTRGQSHSEWIRVPVRDHRGETPVVLGGVAGAALGWCGKHTPTMRPLTDAKLAEWIADAFDSVVPLPPDHSALPSAVADTFRIAGLVELDGPGRLVMENYPLAAVDTTRELAETEGWPARTGTTAGAKDDVVTSTKEAKPEAPAERHTYNDKLYSQLTLALNTAASATRAGRRTSSRYGWRQRMEHDLRDFIALAGDVSNLGLIAEYALHRLKFGGKRIRHPEAGTLHKEVTRFGRALLIALGKTSLLALSSEGLETDYLAVLQGKPDAERADVLEDLVGFQHYLEFTHHVPAVEFARLRTFTGLRVRCADKGTFTDAEIGLLFAELDADIARERARVDASPEAIRLCELRALMFLLLESSGLRPESVQGLLLCDLYLLGEGRDFVHVHKSGGYGAAKTSTSNGFVPCEGAAWANRRQQVIQWAERERSKLGDDWWKVPLFGVATGARVNFSTTYLTARINQLAKWVTGSGRAHTYWLRKRRMTARLRNLLDTPAPSARAVFRVLHICGEADILTPLRHYIHDAAVPLRTYLDVAGRADRAGVLAITDLRANPLDMKWHKQRRKGDASFFGIVYDSLAVGFAARPEGRLTEAPALARQKTLVPAHVDRYARLLQRGMDRSEAMTRCGISDEQATRLDESARQMVLQRGSAPWSLPGVRQRAALIRQARRLRGTEKLFKLLQRQPDAWLVQLTHVWLRNAHIDRIHGADVALVVKGPFECEAAKTLIERTEIRGGAPSVL